MTKIQLTPEEHARYQEMMEEIKARQHSAHKRWAGIGVRTDEATLTKIVEEYRKSQSITHVSRTIGVSRNLVLKYLRLKGLRT